MTYPDSVTGNNRRFVHTDHLILDETTSDQPEKIVLCQKHETTVISQTPKELPLNLQLC